MQSQLRSLQQKAQDAQLSAQTQGRGELLSGVGDFVGLFSSGRKTTVGLSRMASRRSKASASSARAAKAQARAQEKYAEVASEISSMYEALQRKGAEVEAIDVHLEKDDIRVVDASVIWLGV